MENNPILMSLFIKMNNDGILYGVLRNYKLLPESTGRSDLDMWIDVASYTDFIRILREICWETEARLVSYKEDPTCPQYTLCSHLFGIQIDLYIGLANHKGVSYVDAELIADHLMEHNGIKALRPEIDGLMCFLKEILNNKKCKIEYCEKANHAIRNLGDYEAMEYLKAFSPQIAKKILRVIKSKDFSEESIKKLGQLASHDLQSLLSRVKHLVGQLYKLKRFFCPLGYTIAFLGTDGSGKSTIIDAITPILNEAFHKGVRYEHMRPNYMPSLAVLTGRKKNTDRVEVCTDPHGAKTSGFWGSLFRISYYMIDYTYGYFRKVYYDKSVKNHVWIFDRYFYDYMNDSQRACISLPHEVLRVYGWLVPSPDLTICLGTDAETIHARKPELPLEEVRRQVECLKKFANKNNKAIWIDTGCSIEESRDATMKAIVSMMEKRFTDVLI